MMSVPLLDLHAQDDPLRRTLSQPWSECRLDRALSILTPVTYNFNPSRIESAIASRTRAINLASLHWQECLHTLGYVEGDFAEAERACRKLLTLPIYYPELNEGQRHYVVQTVREDFAQ